MLKSIHCKDLPTFRNIDFNNPFSCFDSMCHDLTPLKSDDLRFDAPMSWIPPNHPALAPFDPEKFEHHRLKIDQPTIVIRGLTPNLDSHHDEYAHLITKTLKKDNSIKHQAVETCIPDELAEDECAIVDTLSLSLKLDNYEKACGANVSDTDFNVSNLLVMLSNDWSNMAGLSIDPRDRGKKNHYDHCHKFVYSHSLDDKTEYVDLGFIAFGGERQNGTLQIYLTGAACEYINSDRTTWVKIRDWCKTLRVKISRIDLAYDDLEAELFDIYKVNEEAEMGLYSSQHGGRKVRSHSQPGDWANNDRDNKGLTVNVGQRASCKSWRIYQKGKQLGNIYSEWIRAECEFHGDKHYVIPYDTLIQPGKYLAGSCPAMNRISDRRIEFRAIRKNKARMTMDKGISWLKHQGGKWINAMSESGYSDSQIIEELRRPGIPSSLKLPLGAKLPYQKADLKDYEKTDPLGLATDIAAEKLRAAKQYVDNLSNMSNSEFLSKKYTVNTYNACNT